MPIQRKPSINSTAVQMYFFQLYAENRSDLYHQEYPLFNNRRQQLRVTIRMTGADANNAVVSLSAADLATLKLIDYDTSEEIPFENLSDKLWSYGTQMGGYLYDLHFFNYLSTLETQSPDLFGTEPPASSPGVDACHEPGVNAGALLPGPSTAAFSDHERTRLTSLPNAVQDYQFVDFLIATGATTSRRLAVKITLGNVTVRTNYPEVRDDQGLGDLGKFNSSIRIVPRAFPPLPGQNYGDRSATRPHILHDIPVAHGTANTRVFEHHLNIRLPGGSMVNIDHATERDGRSAPTIFADRGTGWSCAASHTYIAQPNQSTIAYNIPPYIGDHGSYPSSSRWINYILPNKKAVNIRAGQVVIGHLLTGERHWFYTYPNAASEAPKVTTVGINLYDVYGNLHPVLLSFESPTYHNYLTLQKG